MLTLTSPRTSANTPALPGPFWALTVLLLGLLLAYWLYEGVLPAAPPQEFPVEIITKDITVDWTGGGPEFDPWNRCPQDFFKQGFVLLGKRLRGNQVVKFLYHKGKKLLYRIDLDDLPTGKSIGLHWVTGTRFNAKYRLADKSFVGGKAVAQPTGKGTTATATYHYGDAVGKRATGRKRELFAPTHIDTDNCPDWFELFNLPL